MLIEHFEESGEKGEEREEEEEENGQDVRDAGQYFLSSLVMVNLCAATTRKQMMIRMQM